MERTRLAVVIAAYNEGDRIADTVTALTAAFPGAKIFVADDGSSDDTAARAAQAGAEVVSSGKLIGKGGAATLGARAALLTESELVLLCDGDLAGSAAALGALLEAVERGEGDLAVARFARKVGGGFGFAVGFARWAINNLVGLEFAAPISGQRAIRAEALALVLPFAPRFGMEIGMTVDATRAGFSVVEVEVDLEHRATGRSWRGFAHRFRQLLDFIAVWISRRLRNRFAR
ncbi:MAG: glycosyltransferase [Solirubrobacteraceae bacterium]|jgi:glycosyltransferase involved in cell wall biosynthesis|nr:glycosyltransferase [Solirubrobacteraceae bacterium]MDP4920503.1 glycosyltransferase [Solirubrobacteraceae bacterium]